VTRYTSIEALLFNGFGKSSPFPDCAHVTVGGIWCVEEVGNYHGQEAGQKCGFDSSRNKWTFGSAMAWVEEEARRNSVEPEKNTDTSGSCDVSVKCDDVRCFV